MQRIELAIITYTEEGEKIAATVKAAVGDDCVICRKGDGFSMEQLFAEADAILFIAACGIAVRKIAPHLSSKVTDPAVLCMDTAAQFVIPLVSGHLGGANAWAKRLSDITEATAVITTATDIRGMFAADVAASAHGFVISDPSMIKEVSSAVLRKEPVGLFDELRSPMSLAFCAEAGEATVYESFEEDDSGQKRPKVGIVLTADETRPSVFEKELRLFPKDLCVGIGCKKGKSEEKIASFVREVFADHSLSVSRIACIASARAKKDEAGLRDYAHHLKVPFLTFSSEELMKEEGTFTASSFVLDTVGADNVCERSVACVCHTPPFLKKTARDGITISVGTMPVAREEDYG